MSAYAERGSLGNAQRRHPAGNRIAHLAVVAPALWSEIAAAWNFSGIEILRGDRAVARLDPLPPDRQTQALHTI